MIKYFTNLTILYFIGDYSMNYDANVFKAKANIKARRIWLVFSLLLTANYGTDAANGIYPKAAT